jgi:MarR family transcriptional regulator, transcriptional regulator for hemolysin
VNGPPPTEPIGLHVARAAKVLERAFEDALAAAGGSRPAWLILLSLKSGRWETQRELADRLGIKAATLTHHLAALERDGLVRRERDPGNRRAQRMALTDAGDAAFDRLRTAAVAFDRDLRAGLDADELEQFRAVLERLAGNAAAAR